MKEEDLIKIKREIKDYPIDLNRLVVWIINAPQR